ncbi:DUF975 family protein [uncultured Intestinimonas sp.]|uniref:DUF975 family protein n=1 Tax=uncultured Intestinimonas sp. TaxID=1689265 RepID=UPI0025E5C223|nr:DUF975 family protein [uncultured Intestinimonas sp.]
MNYDRVRVKGLARAAIRRGRPRPWTVTLVYTLLTTLPGAGLSYAASLSETLISGLASSPREAAVLAALAAGGCGVLVGLLAAVLATGYTYYAMNLWRGRRADFPDLFQGLALAGRVVPLFLLTLALTVLWCLAGMALCLPALAAGLLLRSQAALFLLLVLGAAGGLVLLLNRLLRYALAYHLLLDHPDWSAVSCLHASKRLMQGRRWSLVVLECSFLGWHLLRAVIALAAAAAVFGAAFQLAVSMGWSHSHGAMWLVFLLAALAALALGSLCTLPLTLWLAPYIHTAHAGFYDCAAGYGYPTAAPFQDAPAAPGTLPIPGLQTPEG